MGRYFRRGWSGGWEQLPDNVSNLEQFGYNLLRSRQWRDSDNGYSEFVEFQINGERTYSVADYTYGLGNPDDESIGIIDTASYGSLIEMQKRYDADCIEPDPHNPERDWIKV
ncbi:hypothetical protein PUR29_34810 [Methylobacterium ajmalii]|uniref:Uncharacterized protein n=1 Tax=Methylobacterium ajmalii TaxID=2738439 RepID=A0ABV0A7D7_9HYPH